MRNFGFSILISLILLFLAFPASAAVLSLSPSSGTFEVGSTFTVSVFLDTQGQPINVVEVHLRFPPNLLQLVSPTTGKSAIEVWTSTPTYNNKDGTIDLSGGIPGGINSSRALVTTLEFRVKSPGTAAVRFTDQSKVLAHDGRGTDVLYSATDGVYNLVFPPPAGPIVSSPTHPDQNVWYRSHTVTLHWTSAGEGVEEYSYVLSQDPTVVPDNISEGSKTSVTYKDLSNGTHYFHIKAFRDGKWGGVTTFAINIDTEPPAEFKPDLEPNPPTTQTTIVAKWQTTDRHSGISHYEYTLLPLHFDTQEVEARSQENIQPFFIEAPPPVILHTDLGKYDLVVRAFDNAGNIREATVRIEVLTPFGMALRNIWFWVFISIITILLTIIAVRTVEYKKHIERVHKQKRLPVHIQRQLEELKRYRQKYGKLGIFLLVFGFWAVLFASSNTVLAQETSVLAPPFVSTVSKNISNNEIFYIGGKTDAGNIRVVIFLQNLRTGETRSFEVESNDKGEWFYRHDTFLGAGEYLLWTQAKFGDQVSPPSPQIKMSVAQTAIQFGASRLSYETLYMIIAIILLVFNVGLILFIISHFKHARARHVAWLKEVHEAEQSVKRGFAVLKRDIERELEIIHKAKLNRKLSEEEKRREEQLLRDLKWAEQYIGKEIWDIEESIR